MKHLSDLIKDTINESKYRISKAFDRDAKDALDELVSMLPELPGHDHEKINVTTRIPGISTIPVESAEYIGCPYNIVLPINPANCNVDIIKKAFENLFKITIDESIFSNNIKKDMPEYKWIKEFHDALSKYFRTKDFSKVKHKGYNPYFYRPEIYKDIILCPTIEVGDLFVTLYSFDFSHLEQKSIYPGIEFVAFVYKKKK